MSQFRKGGCGLSRRVGVDLEKKSGVKPIEKKCKFEQLPGKPLGRRSRGSDYSNQLTMKQTMRYYYGMSEKQFRNLYKKSDRMSGSTGDNLVILLESRLDNVVYRLGFAATRAEARQMVSHGHISVNDQRVQVATELHSQKEPIEWLERQKKAFSGKILAHADPAFFAEMFKVNLVIELYSK